MFYNVCVLIWEGSVGLRDGSWNPLEACPSYVLDDSVAVLSRTTDQGTYRWLLSVAWASHRMVTRILREHPKRELLERATSARKEHGKASPEQSSRVTGITGTIVRRRGQLGPPHPMNRVWRAWGDSPVIPIGA